MSFKNKKITFTTMYLNCFQVFLMYVIKASLINFHRNPVINVKVFISETFK